MTTELGADDTLVEGEPVRRDALARGDVVGRYVVLDTLGAGAMGIVYAAYDPELDRKVALKLLHPYATAPADGSGGHRRLLGEAQALARLSHPNVLAVHDVGEHAGRVFLATELVDGSTLGVWLAPGSRTRAEILEVFAQAGRGLAAAHEAGLVHRDFKPDNVMVGADGRVRVMDFGLARASRRAVVGESHGAERSSTAGTPAYMAPEQHLGEALDVRTDQFAFCVALWEALYGMRPFRAASLPELATRVVEGWVQEPPSARGVPGWLRAVLMRGLSSAPSDRYPDMATLLRALADDPTPRRRRIGLTVGLVALGIAAWGGAEVSRAQVSSACEARGEEIATDWSPAIAQAIGQAFSATRTEYAEVAHATVVQEIDRFAGAWAKARAETCVAGELDGTLDTASRERRDACLDDGRAELVSLVQLLQTDDPQLVQNAVDVVKDLTPVERCMDDVRLAEEASSRGDPVLREVMAAVRAKLARVRQLDTLGRYADAAEAAEEASVLVQPLGQGELRVQVDRWRALERGRLGDYEGAYDDLLAVYFDAGRVGADETAARTAVDLVRATGNNMARFDEALLWARHAEMLLARVGESDGIEAAELSSQVGHVHRQRDEHDEAIARFEAALAQRERRLGADHPAVAATWISISNVHHARGAHTEARAALERAQAVFSVAYGPDHPHVAVVHNNLGLVATSLHDHAAALEHHRRSLAIREGSFGPDHPQVALALVNLATGLTQLGAIEEAEKHLQRALRIREKTLAPDHPAISFVLNNLGILAREQGRIDEALALFRRSLEIREASLPPDHIDVAAALVGVAQAQVDLGDHRAALPLLERASRIAEPSGPEHPEAVRVSALLGWARFLDGDAEIGIELMERTLQRHVAEGVGSSDYAELQFRLAQALAERDRPRSLQLARAAADQYRDTGARGERARAKIDAWLRQME